MEIKVSGIHGHAIIWIHGFCISSEIWDKCLPYFEDSFTCIQIDLPGFGKSPLTYFKNLKDLAEQIYLALKPLNVKSASIIGHSLGGYLALELLKKHPEFCHSLILFHSNALGDSPERKAARKVYLEAFERFGADFFLRNFHENLFYHKDLTLINELKLKHQSISVETLQQYTEALISRENYTSLLKYPRPKMIIAGSFDQSISNKEYLKMYNLAENCQLLMLANSAHMGMLEEFDISSNEILTFIKKNLKT